MLPAGQASHFFRQNSSVSGAGTVSVSTGSILTADDGGNWAFDTLVIDNTAPLAPDQTTVELGRVVTLNRLDWKGGLLKGDGRLQIAPGGEVDLTADEDRTLDRLTLKLQGTMNWNGGKTVMKDGATLQIDAGGVFDLNASNEISSVRTIDPTTGLLRPAPRILVLPNGKLQKGAGAAPDIKPTIRNLGGTIKMGGAGLASLDGGVEQQAGILEADNATVSLASLGLSGGTVQADGSSLGLGAVTVSGGALSLSNVALTADSITMSAGTASLSNVGGAVSGAVYLNGGSLALSGGPPLYVTGGLHVGPGAALELSGGGTLGGDLFNDGLVSLGSRSSPAPGDAFTVSGSFTQGPSGRLAFDADLFSHDSLSVVGAAALGGSVELALLASPPPGASFGLLNYGSYSGAFSTLSLTAPQGGASAWAGTYGPSDFDFWVF